MIYTSHGLIEHADASRFLHRNLLDRRRFAEHLSGRSAPYVDLEEALAGRGDALTVDDGTHAGAEAAALARQLGHEVAFFVNPSHVIRGEPYFFSELNVVMDHMDDAGRSALAELYPPPRPHKNSRRELRKRIKGHLLRLPTEDARRRRVRELATRAGVRNLTLPRQWQPVRLEDLVRLRDQGVRIANHGWTHGNVDLLERPAAREEIASAARWLRRNLCGGSAAYAVPFGKAEPAWPFDESVYSTWLLLSSHHPQGRLGPRLYNRVELEL